MINLARSRRHRSRLAAGVVVVVSVVTGLLASPASAHTELVSSNPPVRGRVTSIPPDLVLTFNQNLDQTFATVTLAEAGEDPIVLEARVEGSRVVAARPEELSAKPGRTQWRLSYRVVSSDGHPVTGEVPFGLVSSAPATPSASTGPMTAKTPTPAARAESTAASRAEEPAIPSWAAIIVINIAGVGLVVLLIRMLRRRAAER